MSSMPRKTPSRPVARHARAGSSRRPAPAHPAAVRATAAAQAVQPSVEMARTAFNASFAPYQELLRFMAQMRETQANMLHQMDLALDATKRRAENASDMQELIRLQSDLASDNVGRTVNVASALFRSWLETEAALLEEAQAQGSGLTQQWLNEGSAATAPGNGAAAPAAQPGLDLLTQAQSAWAQWTQQWIDKLHESQGR